MINNAGRLGICFKQLIGSGKNKVSQIMLFMQGLRSFLENCSNNQVMGKFMRRQPSRQRQTREPPSGIGIYYQTFNIIEK